MRKKELRYEVCTRAAGQTTLNANRVKGTNL